MKYLLDTQVTARIAFRRIDIADFNRWIDFFTDPTSFIYWKQDIEDPEVNCRRWYERQFERYEKNEGGMNVLIERSTGELMGHAGLLIQEVDGITEMEIGYSLLGEFRNKGFATEAAMKCKEFAFENTFAESLISIISVTNAPSANVATKNGMELEKQTVHKGVDVNIFRIHQHHT